jgi:DNA segregation ATPase FtsK/SpoIIIE-like protein
MDNNFNLLIAVKTLALLDQRKARLYPDQKTFYVWPREDRVVVIFDPSMIDLGKVNQDFAHRLSTMLRGRLVVRTNSRGLFLQVGYEIPPMLEALTSKPLDLSAQPTPYSMPIGSTVSGNDLWVGLMEGDSFLMAGSRGMGKTGLIHGCIQALLHGGKVEVYGFDGKRGVEFSRYIGNPMFRMVHKLGETLTALKAIAANRRRKLLASGQPNMLLYNEMHPDDQIRPIALFVDEAALTNDEEKAGLVEIVERERDTGFYPVLATNRPEAAALLVKTNLVTRICFSVPSWNASQMVLGMNGAEALLKEQGRGLIVFKAKVTEFQSFHVTYPEPSEDTVRMMLERDEAESSAPLIVPMVGNSQSEIASLADTIRGQWMPDMSKRAVGRLLGQTYAGSWASKIDQIISYLSATTTTEIGRNA